MGTDAHKSSSRPYLFKSKGIYLQKSHVYHPISKYPPRDLVIRYRKYAVHDIVKKVTLVPGTDIETQAPCPLYENGHEARAK
jgi:hypothetical protein